VAAQAAARDAICRRSISAAYIMQLVQPPADLNPHRGHRPENPSPLVACPHIEGKVRHPFFKGIREDLL
jgi:hypothetical protein